MTQKIFAKYAAEPLKKSFYFILPKNLKTMKILLLSDTHSYIDERILNYADWADEVWHAGDIGDLSVTDMLKKRKPLRRSEERRVGKECRSWWTSEQYNEK